MTRNILFRADAHPAIGTGDLTSFINLAAYFKKRKWNSHFIIKNYKAGINLLKRNQVTNFRIISEKFNIKQETKIINAYIKRNKINALFLQKSDGDFIDYNQIDRNIFRACAYFKKDLPAGYDLVLNWDVNSKNYFKIQKYPDTKFFLGPEYVILPINFDQKAIRNRVYRKDRKTVLVVLGGGVDKYDFTFKAIKKLDKQKCTMKVKIILGPAYQNIKHLRDFLKHSSLKYEVVLNAKNMFREFMNCDVAIAAGGLTAFESVSTRTPALLVSLYKHQIDRCRYFAKNKKVKYLGFCNIDNLYKEDLYSFTPRRLPEFKNRITEVVDYIDEVCR